MAEFFRIEQIAIKLGDKIENDRSQSQSEGETQDIDSDKSGNIFFGTDMELDIAKTLGATNVFTKPIKISELLEAINEL